MKPALILAAVALAVFARMFRFEVVGLGVPMAIKLDRWTGNTSYFYRGQWSRIESDTAPAEAPPTVKEWTEKPAAPK